MISRNRLSARRSIDAPFITHQCTGLYMINNFNLDYSLKLHVVRTTILHYQYIIKLLLNTVI